MIAANVLSSINALENQLQSKGTNLVQSVNSLEVESKQTGENCGNSLVDGNSERVVSMVSANGSLDNIKASIDSQQEQHDLGLNIIGNNIETAGGRT